MEKAAERESGIISQFIRLARSGSSTGQYYKSMNHALYKMKDEYTMLHYPLYVNESEDFLSAQENLTRHCISYIEPLEGKTVLEVGCGNGVQTKFLATYYKPKLITGIDLNRSNISIANREKQRRGIEHVHFLVDDAQSMRKIKDNYFDVVINIESAFHYPDKQAFLHEIRRVLAPGGSFIIADIVSTTGSRKPDKITWKTRMKLHHWTLGQYHEGIRNAGLEIMASDNITQDVIKGFLNYRSYFRHMKKRNIFYTAIFRLFYIINLRLNVRNLRNNKQYIIVSGFRPVTA
ncbi:MAG: methyltransferase domain-containing protein [Bacteroidales bacterium]|nr:methyltransferase domain-containing protein [Bacteroidales bacterium]